MNYFREKKDIYSIIEKLSTSSILWLDTEVADWYTPNPRLSLIQVLEVGTDLTGENAYILDVLNKPDLVENFLSQIMVNPRIEKVFHNAAFDLRYLGQQRARNVTCTLKIAKQIPLSRLGTTNRKLKTLAVQLCNFNNVDTEEQTSDWGKRPLSKKQLNYCKMDVVYLAAVHHRLLELTGFSVKSKSMEKYHPTNLREPINQTNSSNPTNPTNPTNQTNLSVTDIQLAFQCPRLFYLAHHFGGKPLFIPKDRPSGLGKTFHHLSRQLLEIAAKEPQFKTLLASKSLEVAELGEKMQALFYKLAFLPYLQTEIAKTPGKAEILYQLWQGLRGLIARWARLLASNRPYCSAEQLIEKTFIASEYKLQHQFTLPNGSKQLVVGIFDSLILDFQRQRHCVVEYKTYEPVDPSAQLAQVALYSYMVKENKKIAAVDSAVYCVLPEFKEYYYSWEELEKTVHQLIPHKLQQMLQWLNWSSGDKTTAPPATTQSHLCAICPQQEKCQTFFETKEENKNREQTTNTSTTLRLRSGQALSAGNKQQTTNNKQQITNNQQLTTELIDTLKSFNIGVDYLGTAVGSAFTRVKLKPHRGVKVVSILNRAADLQVQLGLVSPPLISVQAGYVSVDLPREHREVAAFDRYLQKSQTANDAPMKIAIGINLNGELVEADLADANTCHFLIGGTTGSGKSEFLRSLLLSLLYRYSPQQLRIALVDPKRVTFPEFEPMPWLLAKVVKESDRALELMEELVGEMERRYQLFELARCSDLGSYNQQKTEILPRIVCIFDEYADFMADKEISKFLELYIKRLGAMARAAGIHLIIATQRPEAKVVTPVIRSNLPVKIALRTASEADSKIILDRTEAAYLLGKGDLLYKVGSQVERLQSLFAQEIEI